MLFHNLLQKRTMFNSTTPTPVFRSHDQQRHCFSEGPTQPTQYSYRSGASGGFLATLKGNAILDFMAPMLPSLDRPLCLPTTTECLNPLLPI